MATAVIGALRVNLSINSAEFQRGLTVAERTLQRFDRALASALKTGLTAFAAGATTGAAALAYLTKSSMETISAQVDLARRVGASIAAIQTLQQAAKLSGASNEALAKTLGTLNARLGEAAREGAGPAYEALKRLGLSARELSQMDADERIKAISDRMMELGYTTQQQADALRDLGVRQQEIINLFQEGSGAIDEARADLQAWGVLLSDVDAAKVEAAGDAWDRIGAILQGVGNQLAVRLAPIIKAVADYVGDAAKKTGGFGDIIDKAISLGIRLFAAINREIYDFRISVDGVIGGVLDLFDVIAGAPPNLLASIFGGEAEDYGFKPVNESFGRLKDELKKPPSDEEWDTWFKELRRKMDEAARVAVRKKFVETGEDDGKPTEAEIKEQERLRKQLEQKLETVRQSLMTERELELANYAQRELDLKDFHARGLLSDIEYRDLLLRSSADHAAKMKEIDDDVARNQQKNARLQERAIFSIADNIGSALDSLFGENKAVAMAMAVINTAQAVTRNLAEYPGPLGLAAAAAAAAAGAAEIATIASTSKAGGGGGRRGGGGSSVAAAAPQAAAGQGAAAGSNQTITVSGINPGQIFTGEAMREFMAQLIEAQRDGAKIILSPV